MYDLNSALGNLRFTFARNAAEAEADVARLGREKELHLGAFPPEELGSDAAQGVRYSYDRKIKDASARALLFNAKAEVAGRGYLLVAPDETLVSGWNSGEMFQEAMKADRVIFKEPEAIELTAASVAVPA